MSKPVYEQLHLKLEGYNQDNYDNMYDRLFKLKLSFKKKFYYIYFKMLDIVMDEIDNRPLELVSTLEERNNKYKELRDIKEVVDYFESIIVEDDNIEFEDAWLNRFDDFKEEMSNISDFELINIEIQISSILTILEFMLVKEDEYWMVRNNFTLFLLKESGFKFHKEKERVWQPKNF